MSNSFVLTDHMLGVIMFDIDAGKKILAMQFVRDRISQCPLKLSLLASKRIVDAIALGNYEHNGDVIIVRYEE